MQELARVTLQNEMDLILAHRRAMKLAELVGLSLSAQTTFATAVSEVSRNSIDNGKNGCLLLSVSKENNKKFIVATVVDEELKERTYSGLTYAKRLVDKYNVLSQGKETSIQLYFAVPSRDAFTAEQVDQWKGIFRNELPITPYEEIKRKNEQLQELTERLKESEDQFRTLTNALPLIIFSLDPFNTMIYANDWLKRFTGMTLSELDKNKWKPIVHPEDYPVFQSVMNTDAASRASVIKVQIRIRHRSEEGWYWHMLSISPLTDEKGNLLYRIGFIVDINSQKLVEETLKDNKELKRIQLALEEKQHELESNIKELNRSNIELQQFAFVASHDLQEPIRKAGYYSDYLLHHYEDKLDEKGQQYLNGLVGSARRMRNLVHDLLSFSQVNKQKLVVTETDLNDLLRKAVENLDIPIREKNAVVTADPLPVVEGDADMLLQVFENIIGNSLKYSRPDLAPEIYISSTSSAGHVSVSIRDNGVGFEEKYLPKLFMLFQRLHTDTHKGTGLGLAICKKIVELHNGTITASAKENEGAVFTFTIPTKLESR